MSALDDVYFFGQVLKDMERVVICSPDLESRVKSRIAALGLENLWTVQVQVSLPDGKLFIVDPNAVEALCRQHVQQCVIGGRR